MSQQDKRSRRRRPSDERNDVRRKKRHSNRKNTSDRHRRRRKVKKRENKLSRTIGLVLAIVQLIATGIFMAGIFKLNMLPTKYVVAATVALVLFWGVILASQFFSKKNAITGKIISVLITVLLIFSSYYLFKVSGTVSKISGGEYKLDKVVVSVMADDSAEAIKDAKNYTFGVQYKMNGDQIKQTVQAINEELGTEIKTEEYDTLAEQAEALHDGKVDAIIYNQGFTGVLEEAFEGYEDNTKVIYSHDIKTEIEDTSSDVEVKNDTFSVYISGIDVYGAIETNSRSDVNIIAEVNPTTHQILLVTTPRDYYVEIPEVSGGQKDKLTHAGIYGVDKSMKTLEKLYDTNLDFYARVNFTSLITMVDALGGVDVESEYAFTTSEDSGLVMDVVQGTNHFNGKQALAFSSKKVSIDFGAQSATLVYDEASNTYKKEIDGNAQIDGKTGNQLAFTNVFVLETTISVKDDLGHKAVDWDGWEDSMGYYISNGAKQKIHWSKEENNELSRLTFYDESGNEISINRGKSYIAFNYPNQTTYE